MTRLFESVTAQKFKHASLNLDLGSRQRKAFAKKVWSQVKLRNIRVLGGKGLKGYSKGTKPHSTMNGPKDTSAMMWPKGFAYAMCKSKPGIVHV